MILVWCGFYRKGMNYGKLTLDGVVASVSFDQHKHGSAEPGEVSIVLFKTR